MSKRQFMAAGCLPGLLLGIVRTVYDPPSWPESWTHMKPKILIGLTIGGTLPYLALATFGALVGLFFAVLSPRLPQFNYRVQAGLVYAGACFPLYLLWLTLRGYYPMYAFDLDFVLMSFLLFWVDALLMSAVFACLCPRPLTEGP
ncbi:MAG TPA: hypothetical protein VK463_19040 [Desulfomonilaceae bacterium]|nr:hypothetical protein [Desulfomonilaceae bacterium]